MLSLHGDQLLEAGKGQGAGSPLEGAETQCPANTSM